MAEKKKKKKEPDVRVIRVNNVVIEHIQPKLEEKEALVTVSTTVLKQQTSKTKRIKIRPFVTAPATVSVKYGMTQGLPNYGSIRADVMISCPAYVEEIVEVYNQVREMVDELMEVELKRFEEEK